MSEEYLFTANNGEKYKLVSNKHDTCPCCGQMIDPCKNACCFGGHRACLGNNSRRDLGLPQCELGVHWEKVKEEK